MKYLLCLVPVTVLGALASAMNVLNLDPSEYDIREVPKNLKDLAEHNEGSLSVTRRITSVRPGDMMQVTFDIPTDKRNTPNFSSLIAAVYNPSDGSLVHVLGKTLATQVQGLKDAEFMGGSGLNLHIPVRGLGEVQKFSMFKLALIAPENESTGQWKTYSADTMLFAYDGGH
ncbi:hypothetical protein DL89DRAFT_266523 [Linderina pennispora]|uniref:Uncharacterized protein n=1 Tax=Linderina pennispora TaxID=61395 RepID=A0A1Y1WD99_9FUNG|nr:uncharacterized protein DL89DRAFT_266523 [Linderina pennispora]ORX71510.1 hypothetical protein DL89DRAFT_266523 [Linderina pennispora]